MSVIVEGVAISANRMGSTPHAVRDEIQAAMEDAARQAYAHGVNDPDAVRDRIQAARMAVKAKHAK